MAGQTICAGCGLACHAMAQCPDLKRLDDIDQTLDRIEDNLDRLGELVAELVVLDK
jgi:hypothetical protein